MRRARNYFPVVTLLFLGSCWQVSQAQTDLFISAQEAADPSLVKTRLVVDLETYIFFQPARFYALRVGYLYGLQNDRHLFGLSIPIVHNVFAEDLQGFENTTGFGDFKMWYMTVFPLNQSIGLNKIAPYFEITAPTGEYLLGRGAGTWLYEPGVIFTWTPDPMVTLYPEIRFQFSADDANVTGGSDIPDIENPEKDGRLQNLVVQLPAVVNLSSAQAWAGLTAQYQQSFGTSEYYIFLRTEFGKVIGDKTAASLSLTKFISGQPRVNAWVQAKFQFYFR